MRRKEAGRALRTRVVGAAEALFGLVLLSAFLIVIARLFPSLNALTSPLLAFFWSIYLVYLIYLTLVGIIKGIIFLFRRLISALTKSKRGRGSFEVKVPQDKFVHAKIYVVDDKSFLGSVNLTKSGINKNVECVVELDRNKGSTVEKEFAKIWRSI